MTSVFNASWILFVITLWSSLQIHALGYTWWILSYFDSVMMRFMINDKAEAFKGVHSMLIVTTIIYRLLHTNEVYDVQEYKIIHVHSSPYIHQWSHCNIRYACTCMSITQDTATWLVMDLYLKPWCLMSLKRISLIYHKGVNRYM